MGYLIKKVIKNSKFKIKGLFGWCFQELFFVLENKKY